jgi:hypothetical protein
MERISLGANRYAVDFTGQAYRAVEKISPERAREMIGLAWKQMNEENLTAMLLNYVKTPWEQEFYEKYKGPVSRSW